MRAAPSHPTGPSPGPAAGPPPALAEGERLPGLGRVLRLRAIGLSVRVEPRTLAVTAALVATGVVLLVLAVGTGEFEIPPGEVVATLLGGGDASTQFVVETLRLPRAVTGLLVGAALGASGAVFQSITRNPLGAPDIIGFIEGASAGAVLQIIVFGGGTFAIAAASIVGGLVTAFVVYVLALRRRSVQGYQLVLIGIGISAMLSAVTDYLVSRATLEQAQLATLWIVGSLNGRGWEHAVPVALTLLVLLPAIALLARPLRMLEMGDDAAHALGVPVERARLALIVVGVALCAVATASAGPIIFVALAAPQIARRLTRASGPGVGAAALMGAILLVASDLLAQRVFPSATLPVGVVTGVLGGLYLIGLLATEWRKGQA